MVEESDRVQFMSMKIKTGEELSLYQRYIGNGTELWFFGSGLGEYTMFNQIGDSFLSLVDKGEDPELGRIIFSIGHGITAFMSYRGDHNLCWIWSLPVDKVKDYINQLPCKQDLFVSIDPEINRAASEHGLKTLQMCSGVNPRLFYPLNLRRDGIAYAGLDNKSKAQRSIVIEPAMKYQGFEWVSQFTNKLMSIKELNEYYNKKQIMLGMVDEGRHGRPYMPTKVMETLATGTPLIIYKLFETENYLGFHYPYMTESAEQTDQLIQQILSDYDETINTFKEYSKKVVERHNYENKLKCIFKELEAT